MKGQAFICDLVTMVTTCAYQGFWRDVQLCSSANRMSPTGSLKPDVPEAMLRIC